MIDLSQFVGMSEHLPLKSHTWRMSSLRRVSMRKEHDFSKGKRGPAVPDRPGGMRIIMRRDDGVAEWFDERVCWPSGHTEIRSCVL
jgi:hypothetical protein